jgi:uncharacterized membrane protein YqaE (UPF0057 family)
MRMLEIIVAVIIPPIGVAMTFGFGRQFWINLLLTLLGYIPGVIHAIVLLTKKD